MLAVLNRYFEQVAIVSQVFVKKNFGKPLSAEQQIVYNDK